MKSNWIYAYQSRGLICEFVKKQAFIGSPMPSIMLSTGLPKKSSGGVLLIDGASSTAAIWAVISGRYHRMVAAKLSEKIEWCGVVWCGVVWCGVVWCGVVW